MVGICETRKIWGGIVNNCHTWTIMVRNMVNNENAVERRNTADIQKE